MKLTDLQRRTLLYYRGQRTRKPTLWGMLRASLSKTAGNAVIVAVVVGVSLAVSFPIVGGIALGYWVGMLNRDVRSYSKWTKVWEVYMHVIDWKKVDELLSQRSTA